MPCLGVFLQCGHRKTPLSVSHGCSFGSCIVSGRTVSAAKAAPVAASSPAWYAVSRAAVATCATLSPNSTGLRYLLACASAHAFAAISVVVSAMGHLFGGLGGLGPARRRSCSNQIDTRESLFVHRQEVHHSGGRYAFAFPIRNRRHGYTKHARNLRGVAKCADDFGCMWVHATNY